MTDPVAGNQFMGLAKTFIRKKFPADPVQEKRFRFRECFVAEIQYEAIVLVVQVLFLIS
jgi:hypothetical protein